MEPEESGYIYPLEVGNTWVYDRSMIFTEVDEGMINESYSVIQNEITEIDQLNNNISAYRMHTRDSSYTGDVYADHLNSSLGAVFYFGILS